MFFDFASRLRLNLDLFEKEKGAYLSGDEKAALRRAEKAEKAFRKSKGYEPDTFWHRLKKRWK